MPLTLSVFWKDSKAWTNIESISKIDICKMLGREIVVRKTGRIKEAKLSQNPLTGEWHETSRSHHRPGRQTIRKRFTF